MIGELQSRQIVALAEDGMSAEEIATATETDLSLVKLVIARSTQDGDRDITDEDLKKLRRHAVELAFRAEDESVQARMTQWLIERDKPVKKEVQISPILAINQAIIDARGAFGDLMKEYVKPLPESNG